MDDGPLHGRDADQDARCNPLSVDFGSATVGAPPASASVTVTNTGSVILEISQAEITGTAPGCRLPRTPARAFDRPEVDVHGRPLVCPAIAGDAGRPLDLESDADVSPLVVPIQGSAIAPSSGVTWGSNTKAGPDYTWNSGGALARTVQSGRNGCIRVRDRSSWRRMGQDGGPYVGVYYVRSSTGSTWSSAPKRLNSSSQHAARLGLAAAGSRVYATSVSQAKWVKVTEGPRLL